MVTTLENKTIWRMKIDRRLSQMVKIEAAKDGISMTSWFTHLIRVELERRGVKIDE